MARAAAAQPNLTLDMYRRIMNIPMCVFNGVEDPDESKFACDHIWLQWQREELAHALRMAEDTLAGQLMFTLGLEYQVSRQEPWVEPHQLDWGHIVGGGIQGLTTIALADIVAQDFTIDPATITVAQSHFPGGADEIYIIETYSGLEIVPDRIDTLGVNYIIYISQCKLIEWDNLRNQTVSILYDNTFPGATWLKFADLTLYREYLDDSTQATITYGPWCDCACAGTACAGTSYTGCVYVIDAEISKVRIQMANYSAGSWTCALPILSSGCYAGDKVSVHYQAGTISIPGYERAIIRLAHSYMDWEPCGCAAFDYAWHRDRQIPSVLTAERVNCPFGMTDGAWFAWQWAEVHKHGKAFML
jgi:hypothetical protein